jgi:hypothetical protein
MDAEVDAEEEKGAISLLKCPSSDELVARKTLKFSFMITGKDIPSNNLYVAAILVCSSTLKPINDGLMDKKPKRGFLVVPGYKTVIMKRVVSHRDSNMEFQIVKGSAKKAIRNSVKFELRFYKKNNDYEVIDSVFSTPYRILTHSSQLGRGK